MPHPEATPFETWLTEMLQDGIDREMGWDGIDRPASCIPSTDTPEPPEQ